MDLPNAVAAFAASVSGGYIRTFLQTLQNTTLLIDMTDLRISRDIPDLRAAEHCCALVALVRASFPNTTPSALALAIASTAAAQDRFYELNQVDVVWTGPRALTTRSNAAVLKELIENAQREIVILSFASFRLRDMEAVLSRAAKRGVEFHILLESEDDSGGRIHSGWTSFQDSLPASPTVQYYRWPPERRGPGALMHAKMIVADSERALVTSANLTENALNVNVELGLLVRGFDAPKKLRDQMFALIDAGYFASIDLPGSRSDPSHH